MSRASRVKAYLDEFNRFDGQTYIVTGANSGLGFSTTKHLLSLGASVVMACRNIDKATKAYDDLMNLYPKAKIHILNYDQADFKSIDKFILEVKNNYPYFSGLILNAGIFHPKKGLKTKDGFPLTVGTNYLGIFYLLTKLKESHVFDRLIERKIVFIGSLSWYKIKSSKIQEIFTNQKGSSITRYSKSKTFLGALAYEIQKHDKLSQLYFPKHIKILLMHPGVTSTNIVSSSQSSYPKWFSKLAINALNIFVHRPDIASLGIIKLICDKDAKEDMISVPRGLFSVSGYPKFKKYPKNLRYIGKEVIKISYQKINKLD